MEDQDTPYDKGTIKLSRVNKSLWIGGGVLGDGNRAELSITQR
jgi:hypothetical protein